MATTEIPAKFQEILRKHLPYAEYGEIEGSNGLADLGLDSMSIVQLLGDLEDGYEIEFPDDVVNEETFATVESLWRTLESLVDLDRDGS